MTNGTCGVIQPSLRDVTSHRPEPGSELPGYFQISLREIPAPVLDIKQSSTLVRMRDGETIVMGGLIQNSAAKATRKIPLLGDIPWLGKLFQRKVNAKQKKE